MSVALKYLMFLEGLQIASIFLFINALRKDSRKLVSAGDMLLLVAIPAVGLLGQNKYLFYCLLFAAPLLWIRRPEALARRYFLFLVLFPELSEPFLAANTYLGALSSLTFFNAGAFLAFIATRPKTPRPARSIDVAAWLVFLVSVLFVARGEALGGTARFVITHFLLVIPPYYIASRCIATRRTASDVGVYLVFGGTINAVVGLFESVKHWALYQMFYNQLHVKLPGLSAVFHVRAGFLRAEGPVANYESLGLVIGLALIALLAVRERFTPTGRWLLTALLIGGIVSSQSRSAWIATVIAVTLYAAYEKRWRLAGGLASATAFLGVAASLVSAEGVLGQLLGRSGHGQGTAEYRSRLFSRGIEEILRHPLTGQTPRQLQFTMSDLRQGEGIIDLVNAHLNAGLVGGIAGLLVWLGAWIVPLHAGWRLRRGSARPGGSVPVAFPFAFIAACFVFLCFTSAGDRLLCLVALALGLMSAFIRVGRTAGGDREGSAPVVRRPLVASLPTRAPSLRPMAATSADR